MGAVLAVANLEAAILQKVFWFIHTRNESLGADDIKVADFTEM